LPDKKDNKMETQKKISELQKLYNSSDEKKQKFILDTLSNDVFKIFSNATLTMIRKKKG